MTAIEITYRDALRKALQDAMRADDTVVVIGEEVAPMAARTVSPKT